MKAVSILFSPSLSVISTSLAQPCYKIYFVFHMNKKWPEMNMYLDLG